MAEPLPNGLMLEGDAGAAGGRRVTPLELFLDLVFVFAITQVTTFLARDPTGLGPGARFAHPQRALVGLVLLRVAD